MRDPNPGVSDYPAWKEIALKIKVPRTHKPSVNGAPGKLETQRDHVKRVKAKVSFSSGVDRQ